MERPETLTGERWEMAREEAEGLEGSVGWNIFSGMGLTDAEEDYMWHYIFTDLGLDCCDTCGYYYRIQYMNMGQCESCEEADCED